LIAGKYHVLSVSMDRCFVMSQLTIHAAAPAPPDSKGSTEKVALLSLPVTTSSSSYGTAAAQDSSGQHSCLALQLKGCIPQWVCQGLGGFAYSCAVQHTYPDALEAGPKYSKLRVAVGCGDKTIRVATMGVRAAAAAAVPGAEAAGLDSVQEQQRQQLQQQKKERGQPEAGDSQLQGASAAVVTAAAAAPATLTQPAHSSSTAVSSSAEQQPSSELQLPVPKPTLLWRNIQDRAQALAWHPTNPRKHTTNSCMPCVGLPCLEAELRKLWSCHLPSCFVQGCKHSAGINFSICVSPAHTNAHWRTLACFELMLLSFALLQLLTSPKAEVWSSVGSEPNSGFQGSCS
jgi:hypothetical protein